MERAPRPPKFDLLTAPGGNPKTAKGEAYGWATAVLHLAPASLSGANVCRYATPACTAGCLNGAGRGGVGGPDNPIQRARIRRTRELRRDPKAFLARLAKDIARHEHWCRTNGFFPAVRLNGTSDLPWENLRDVDGLTLFERFPGVRFYDYTKAPIASRPRVRAIPNYSLTFSLAETRESEEHARQALSLGYNVAVVFDARPGKNRPGFDAEPLPETFWGRPVVDGDAHDLRFLDGDAPDGGGLVIGLRAKANTHAARRALRESGFARPVSA